ncbi:predicted protein [Chaetoceros tenuissimus]|uniref:Uncharacterized protein n=1 Tax=Chaetoceros tenuissimus TaxID=426638 RepID=A0AAD3CF51_9STRA|nr:predicted protein [Chaetoceros tenuissimus]
MHELAKAELDVHKTWKAYYSLAALLNTDLDAARAKKSRKWKLESECCYQRVVSRDALSYGCHISYYCLEKVIKGADQSFCWHEENGM